MIRVRFAPSPTGSLHVGGARTALFNYLFAKKNQGQFVLRIEDTDQERNRPAFLKEQLEALSWLGLKWDEGPSLDLKTQYGSYGPYRQSQRTDVYQTHVQQLLDKGCAYYCFLTDQQIDEIKQKALREKKPFRVQSPYREWKLESALQKIQQGERAVIRFKIPEEKKEYSIEDGVRGKVVFPSDMVGDFVLMRSNGIPVYNFCCAVDDALMKISHVFRAEEHLANTLRQLMIFETLGYPPPQYFHLSLILDMDKKKLSKRSGAKSCLEYKDKGYLPEALNNFLALLGWSSEEGKEVFAFSQLVEHFSEKRLNPAGAVFDENKLQWINAQHIRSLPYQKFWEMLASKIKEKGLQFPEDFNWRQRAFLALKSSFSDLKEALEVFQPLSVIQDFQPDSSAIEEIQKEPSSKKVLELWRDELQKISQPYLQLQDFKTIKDKIQKTLNVKGKALFMPLRTALIGKTQGAELNQISVLIPCSEMMVRASQTLKVLSK